MEDGGGGGGWFVWVCVGVLVLDICERLGRCERGGDGMVCGALDGSG